MSSRPNVLFLHSDEHSFRFLSSRGRDRGGEPCHTPTLDGLVSKGANFDAAYCQMPLCTPSRIAMHAGRHAHRCGAWANGSVLDPELPTIASHLQAHGYATATVGKMHLGGCRQFGGFAARPYGDFGGSCGHQYDPLTPSSGENLGGMDMRSRTLDAGISQVPESMLQEQMVVRESIAHLREQRHADPDRPWLLYASFSRPHFPLTAPKRFIDRYCPDGVTPPRVGRSGDAMGHPMTVGAIRGFRTEEIGEEEGIRARAAYFASVDFLDEILGDFLATLDRDGFLDNTVIVYTTDHGEMAGEHGLWWKNVWHDASTRVPLIVSLPQHRTGQLSASEVTAPVSLVDVFPTLCGLTGVPAPDGLDGVDLAPALCGENCPALSARPGVFSEALMPRWGEGTEFRMVRSERHKYIAFRNCDDLAFDLVDDPDEQQNLLPGATGSLASELRDLRDLVMDGFDFDAEEERREQETAELREKYPKRANPCTPNQICLGNGTVVEADAPLYLPETVSRDPAADFEDFPDSES
ncbi:MAG: sulfatase-like hydrolase/transferase [Candidatus Latescibacteria bacterium]|nr:sulfatase-like hydrolase/transferase [Candidatus Latescibacterota bacterium]